MSKTVFDLVNTVVIQFINYLIKWTWSKKKDVNNELTWDEKKLLFVVN